MSSTQIYHLAGPGFSGRGVRVRVLGVDVVDKLYTDAVKEHPTDAVSARLERQRNGVRAMLVAVTRAPVAKVDDLLPSAALKPDWAPVNLQVLISDEALAYSKLFNSKDDGALCEIFKRNHDATMGEVDSIVGKVVEMEEG